MITAKLLMFVTLFSIVIGASSMSKFNEIQRKNVEKKYKESLSYNNAVEEVIEARGNYLKIYGEYPSSIATLISKGMLPSSFSTAEYSKDITLNSDGTVSIANRDIGNEFKNQVLVANQTNLLTEKNLDNTTALIEQKKRFNVLENNEKSIELGNDVTLSKSSSSYSEPSLSSINTITNTSTSNLRGW